jgi:hypothetical protein
MIAELVFSHGVSSVLSIDLSVLLFSFSPDAFSIDLLIIAYVLLLKFDFIISPLLVSLREG